MGAFNSVDEAKELLVKTASKYLDSPEFLRQGKSSVGLKKVVSFILLVKPDDELEEMKDDFIRLKADGYAIVDVEWQPKWGDQMDLLFEIISVSVEVNIKK